jgi:hypothetical protein
VISCCTVWYHARGVVFEQHGHGLGVRHYAVDDVRVAALQTGDRASIAAHPKISNRGQAGGCRPR